MNWVPNIFRRRKLYDDLSEEIRLHIEERAEQLMREGMSAAAKSGNGPPWSQSAPTFDSPSGSCAVLLDSPSPPFSPWRSP